MLWPLNRRNGQFVLAIAVNMGKPIATARLDTGWFPPMARPQIPSHPADRHRWIKFQLEHLGSSFSAIARELGCSQQNVRQATLTPSARAERAIAEKLGLTAQELFPERYQPDGTRRRSRCTDNSGLNPNPCNVDTAEAA
jgi:Ner family transcriptional regulator